MTLFLVIGRDVINNNMGLELEELSNDLVCREAFDLYSNRSRDAYSHFACS
jgi:hypothetical protein